MKKKALFFLQSNCGGAERMTIYIASCLNEAKYDIIFYIIGKDNGVIKQFIPEKYQTKLIKVKSFRDNLVFKMIKILLIEKPNYVFSSTFPINYRLCVASIFLNNVSVIIRSSNYLYTQSLIQKLRLFFAYKFSDVIITQTEEMRQEHISTLFIKKNKVLNYANPIDIESIENKVKSLQSIFDSNLINYVYVGRISIVKGLDILVAAFSKLLKENLNQKLYIVGETGGGFHENYLDLVDQIKELGISDKIIFTGFTNNPYQYMKFANCLVLPSRNEGLPNVIIESLYLGTPVAVTNCIPVIYRIVDDGKNGFITNVDDVDGLAVAMQNASKLGRVTSTYKSASKEEFERLFK